MSEKSFIITSENEYNNLSKWLCGNNIAYSIRGVVILYRVPNDDIVSNIRSKLPF